MAEKRAPKPAYRPWHPAEYDVPTIYAVKALAAGTANEAQQKRGVAWLLNAVCRVDEETFMAENERESSYAQGKRYAALQFRKLANMAPQVVKALEAKEQSHA